MGVRAGLQPDAIARALHGAFCRGVAGDELCKLAATKVHAAGHPYDVVSILTPCEEGNLRLAARIGMGGTTEESTAKAREPLTRKRAAPVRSPDARTADDGARASSKAVLVAVIHRRDEILGEIQVETRARDSFSAADRAAVERVAAALAALL